MCLLNYSPSRHTTMSAADRYYHHNPTSTTTRKGTTKNPPVELKTVNDQQTCAFCKKLVYVEEVKVNSSVGFVCRDCSHPIHNEIRPSRRKGCVWVRGGPFNLFWTEVPRINITHYHLCENSKCRHRISKEHTCCSNECAEAKEEEDRTRVEQARINSWNAACSSQTSFTLRRGIN